MWQALIPILGTIFDKIIPDPAAAADAKLKAMELAQRGELAALVQSSTLKDTTRSETLLKANQGRKWVNIPSTK